VLGGGEAGGVVEGVDVVPPDEDEGDDVLGFRLLTLLVGDGVTTGTVL
jgi:hypothetical protein